jgi:hypothetical protein
MDEPQILIVEDHEPLRVAIQSILEADGWTILSAGDGLEGLEVMSQVCPDLILADIMMPRMDGLALYDAAVRIHSGFLGPGATWDPLREATPFRLRGGTAWIADKVHYCAIFARLNFQGY